MKKLMIAAMFAFPMFSHAASFDCVNASTTVELTICDDEKLSKLDEELNKVYKLARIHDPSIVKSQIDWIKIRNKATSVEQLDDLHQSRIAILKSVGTETIQPIMVRNESAEISSFSTSDNINTVIESVKNNKSDNISVDGSIFNTKKVDYKSPEWLSNCVKDEIKMTYKVNFSGRTDKMTEYKIINALTNAKLKQTMDSINGGYVTKDELFNNCMSGIGF